MVEEAPVRWCDAFPSGISTHSLSFWKASEGFAYKEPIDLDLTFDDGFLRDLSQELFHSNYDPDWQISRQPEVKFIDVFPSLAYLQSIEHMQLTVPIRNLLLRSGVATMAEFMNFSFSRFMDIMGAGQKKGLQLSVELVSFVLNQVRRGTFWAELEGALAPIASENIEVSSTETVFKRDPDRVESERILVQELTRFAYFLHYRGEVDLPIAAAALPGNIPSFQQEYNTELRHVTVGKWLSEFEVPTMAKLIELFEETLQANPVMLTLLRGRIFSTNPKSLEQIGEMVELTRERIRQIEKKITSNFEQYMLDDEYLVHAVRAVKSYCVVPIPEEELLELLPPLTDVSSSGIKVIDFISYFSGLEYRDGWYANSFATTQSQIETAIERSQDEHKIIDQAKMKFFAGKQWHANGTDNLSKWIAKLGYQAYKDKWISGTNLPQRAFLILTVENEPRTGEQIMEALAVDRSIRSLENSLASDERFIRVSRYEWGLASWGLESYGGIQDAIGKYIDEHGSTPINELIAIFAERYKVKPASIRAYASGGQFAIVDGFVKRSVAVRVGRKGVTETKNLYKTDQGLALRITIKFDHIRGSGSSCPAALTTAFGVTTGTKKTFSYGDGQISISQMSLTSNLTSIKKVCDNLSLGEGDQCILFFSSDEVTAKKVDVTKTGEGLIAELAGLSGSDNLAARLSHSFGLEETITLNELHEMAEMRNEFDLVAAIEEII